MNNSKVKKVLMVTESLACGGRETFAINVARGLDKSIYRVDFFTISSKEEFYTDEVKKLGGLIQSSKTECVDSGILNFLKKNIRLMKIVKKEKYDIVHIHADTHLDYLKSFLIDFFCKTKIVIHAHGATGLSGRYKQKLGKFLFKLEKRKKYTRIACSYKAEEYMYDEKYNQVSIVRNPVLLEKFSYSNKCRNNLRKKWGITDDCLVIGQIGRYGSEKNHEFTLIAFKELHLLYPNCRLVLIGNGPLKSKIIYQAERMNLTPYIIFINQTNRVNEYYSAFDVLWFPSTKESLGMVSIEAQLSGLPVIISEGISMEVKINNNVIQLPFDVEKWINSSIELKRITDIDIRNFEEYSMEYVLGQIENVYAYEGKS